MASGPPFNGDGSREKPRWSESKVYSRKTPKSAGVGVGSKKTLVLPSSQNSLASVEDGNLSQQQQQHLTRLDAASDDSTSLNRRQIGRVDSVTGNNNNGMVWNRIKINVSSRSKQELRELKRKLTGELTQVRSLVKKLEAKELQLNSSSVGNGGLKRVSSDVVAGTTRPLNQLSISVLENSQGRGSDVVEKEKRTPKANRFYRNSDFLLAKDKFPPPDSSKKSKSYSGKKGGGGSEGSFGFGMDKQSTQIFKGCNALLGKLMKHKHGWVFNTPVDVRKLGLHDYYNIIKVPMDLGTVKSRLSKNWYKSPREFAEDVRLTFHNAMTYNPKGQDVYIMAEVMLHLFEERWAVMQREFNLNSWIEGDHDYGLPTPTSKKTPVPPPFQEMRRTLDRSESTTLPDFPKPKMPSNATPSGRTPVPKKPKAKEQNKRDMTYEEKQKLSMHLQSLPPEKLDNIVQIIKKRNSSLCQRDDEIEVDIDVVDAETLWELDRFVTNYKKSLSKNKKKVEVVVQGSGEARHYAQEMNLTPAVAEAPKETNQVEKNVSSSSPVQQEKQGDDASKSSSSGSSSSDSGSSSSDSDSDSSSASDGGH
ncbi:Transcription factor gte4 [Thalictrum thalictroides]|uniref:Transcription factor gte4 n=1 Tax=Thalictrum thalictroides TaxID=46969 RepID=A0A7J6VX01_THATH|nr:Transcription factor gte4 [Thalictrum thalictroides]